MAEKYLEEEKVNNTPKSKSGKSGFIIILLGAVIFSAFFFGAFKIVEELKKLENIIVASKTVDSINSTEHQDIKKLEVATEQQSQKINASLSQIESKLTNLEGEIHNKVEPVICEKVDSSQIDTKVQGYIDSQNYLNKNLASIVKIIEAEILEISEDKKVEEKNHLLRLLKSQVKVEKIAEDGASKAEILDILTAASKVLPKNLKSNEYQQIKHYLIPLNRSLKNSEIESFITKLNEVIEFQGKIVKSSVNSYIERSLK